METGTIITRCPNCGHRFRVEVQFPDYKGFETTTTTCPRCKVNLTISDPHDYDVDGFIIQ